MAINFLIDGQLPDGAKLSFGDSQDLEIHHDGSNSYINDDGTGDLYIQTNGTNMFLRDKSSGNTFIAMNTGTADVVLKQNGDKKLATTSTGVKVTGTRSIFAADTVVNSFTGDATIEVYKNTGNSVLMVHQDDGSSEAQLHFRAGGNDTKIITPGDGSGIALIIDTESNTDVFKLDTTGNVLINQKLNVGYSSNNGLNAQVAFKKSDNASADANSRGVAIDYNLSGTTAQTGDHYYEGLFIDADSSATGGDTTNEIRFSGIRAMVEDSGDANDLYGGYFDARNDKTIANDTVANVFGTYSLAYGRHTAGEVKNIVGVQAYAYTDNASSGTNVSSLAGGKFFALQSGDSGKTVNNAYGVYGKVDLAASSNNGTFTNADGIYGEIEIDDADSTISVARAVRGMIDSNAGTITSAYQFYGSTTLAGTITNNWGIYSQNATKNYLDGTLQLGSYGAGTLVTDASGNITVSSGGGAGGPYLPLAGGTLTGDLTISKNVPRILFDNTAGGGLDPILTANGSNFTISTTSITPLTIGLSTGDATFHGDIKQSTRTTLHDNGTITWGAANDYGNLTWDTGYALVGGLSGKGLKLFTNGGSGVALTIDTSQNATFAGDVTLSAGSLSITGGDGGQLLITSGNVAHDAAIDLDTGDTNGQWRIKAEGDDETFHITNVDQGGTSAFTLHPTTKAATFAGNVLISSNLQHVNDDNNEISFTTDAQDFRTNNVSRLDINNAGVRFGGAGARIVTVKDEDDMAANSNVALATQQSIKAYVDNKITGVLTYQGTWNADTNTPTLSSGSGTPGYYYIVSVAGSTNLDGITDWAVGDWAVFSDQATDAWQKIDNTAVGNVSGSGVNNRLVLWSGTSTVDSDSDFYVDGDTIYTNNLGATGSFSIGGDINKTSGNLTLDVAGDIILDADGDDFFFAAGGTNIGKITNDSSNFLIRSLVQDKDIIFKGDDSGTTITALTLDMSENGAATFSGDVKADTHFTSSDTNVTLSTNSDGTVFLRPNGKGSTTAQSTFTTALANIGTGATFAGDVTIGSTTTSATRSLTLQTSSEQDTVLNLKEANANYGFSLTYDGTANDFIIKRHDNSATGAAVLTFNRNDNNATFTGAIAAGSYVSATEFRPTNIVTNKVVKFNGTQLDDSNITDTGSLITLGSDVTVGDELTITTVNQATADPDKFLVGSASNKVGYLTNSQVLGYIGAAPATGGSYLPLAGGTLTGNLSMNNNDITSVNKISFDDGIELFGAGNNNYLKFKSLNANNGGILFQDGDSTIQGYLYYDGGATSAIGFLSGSGEWAVRCIENGAVELRHNNSVKFQTASTGVTITGTATATTFSGDLKGTINTVTTATTQSAGDNTTKVATTAFVTTAISNAPQGTVTGTGTTNFLPKFTATSGQIIDSEISDTGSVIKLGLDASSQETLYIDTTNRKVGFRTSSPGSAFDVNGTIRVRNQLNVGNTNEKNLFVNGNGSAGGQYVQMGNYGSGNYFGITSSENQPKYCASFGSAGKIVEDMRIVTIKLSGNAFKLLKTTGTTLLAAPGANSFIIPYECIIHNTGGTSGSWNSTTATTAAIGFCDNNTCNYPAQFNRLFVINNTLLNTNASWYYAAGVATTGKAMALNKPLLLKASQDITTAPTGSWYIQIRYQVMNKDSGLVNNVDITKTTN